MDSGDSDRDRKLSGTQGNTDNPFIRFRRFADSQISAVLRGIIGLPSAISEGFDANRSWKTESNDLNGENSRANQRAGFEEDGDYSPATHDEDAVNASPESPAGAGPSAKRKIRDDIDLYSPVIKSLSSHLNRTVEDSIDWSKRATGAEFMCNAHKSFLKPVDETPPNILNMIQLMMYNPLNTATHGLGCRLFHSEKSLLPYILLSPYSPLGISSLPSPRQARALYMSPKDGFPYRRAFTDLLLASQGREMCQWKTQEVMDVSEELTSHGSWTDGGVEHPLFDEWDCRISRAYDGVDWIESLSDLGLLSIDQSHWRKVDLRPSWQTTSTPKMTTPTEMSRNSSASAPSMSMEDAQTEQDMYNRFLEVTSSSPNPNFSDLGSLISEMQRLALEQSKHLSQEIHNSSTPQDSTRFLSETLNDLESTLVRVALENGKGRDSTGKQAVPSKQLSKKNIDQSEVKSCLNEEQLKPDVEQEAGRIVSTTKTTERIRLEDGSVRTLVKTEKVFGDGRSVTETAYDQTPPSAWAEDSSKSWLAGNDQQHDAPCQEMWLDAKSRAQQKETEVKKDSTACRKGGWFWN